MSPVPEGRPYPTQSRGRVLFVVPAASPPHPRTRAGTTTVPDPDAPVSDGIAWIALFPGRVSEGVREGLFDGRKVGPAQRRPTTNSVNRWVFAALDPPYKRLLVHPLRPPRTSRQRRGSPARSRPRPASDDRSLAARTMRSGVASGLSVRRWRIDPSKATPTSFNGNPGPGRARCLRRRVAAKTRTDTSHGRPSSRLGDGARPLRRSRASSSRRMSSATGGE